MDIILYTKLLSDKSFFDLNKLHYKYPDVDIKNFIDILKTTAYQTLPLYDFDGNNIVYLDSLLKVKMNSVKILLKPQNYSLNLKSLENEISATLSIENIDFSRDSVRKILKGYAPDNRSEEHIYGMKKGLEFISDINNTINENSLFKLYNIAIGNYLDDDNKFPLGCKYRNDTVYIMGSKVEHIGLNHKKLPDYMKNLIEFINDKSDTNELIKAAIIHFYFAYLHPYFDGNGRMARLVQLWYLVQNGYSAALFIPFSEYINKSREKYYKAYTLIEKNYVISNVIDVTPFVSYFIKNVYNKLEITENINEWNEKFSSLLNQGKITEKEKNLWNYVLSAYGKNEFSTKQLEKDYRDAAYATIRSFVLKFTDYRLFECRKYGNRNKYHIK